MNNKHAIHWGVVHGLNDLAAGYMLASFSASHDRETSLTMLIVYGILGFGGQLPLGFWLDKIRNTKPFAILSIAFLFASLITFFIDPYVAIVLTGIAGAGIHVTGGVICLQVSEGKTSVMGMFTAPGVLGLAIGGAISGIAYWPLIIAAVALVIISYSIFKNNLPNYQAYMKGENLLDAHDWIMLGLLVVMCFRSLIFDLVNLAGQEYPHAALILGISAFAGKLLGGFLAEKYGWKRTVYTGLLLAFILFQFGRDNLYTLAFGIACLQSSVPVTLMMMSRSLPAFPATASAMSLGVSVAIAGLPLYLLSHKYSSIFSSSIMILGIVLLLVVLYLGIKKALLASGLLKIKKSSVTGS